jgi:hypothetical protein
MATRNIVPRANGEGSIGTAAKHWGNGYFDELNTEKLVADDVVAKGPVVDVRAFGAVGDGVTDDTEAIQAAIEKATEKNSIVLFPPGVYVISSKLNYAVSMVGLGNTTTNVVIKAGNNFADDYLVEFYNFGFNKKIENITFDGSFAHGGFGSSYQGAGSSLSYFLKCRFIQCTKAIDFSSTVAVAGGITGTKFESCSWDGNDQSLIVGNNMDEVQFSNCRFGPCSGNVLNPYSIGGNVTFDSCYFALEKTVPSFFGVKHSISIGEHTVSFSRCLFEILGYDSDLTNVFYIGSYNGKLSLKDCYFSISTNSNWTALIRTALDNVSQKWSVHADGLYNVQHANLTIPLVYSYADGLQDNDATNCIIYMNNADNFELPIVSTGYSTKARRILLTGFYKGKLLNNYLLGNNTIEVGYAKTNWDKFTLNNSVREQSINVPSGVFELEVVVKPQGSNDFYAYKKFRVINISASLNVFTVENVSSLLANGNSHCKTTDITVTQNDANSVKIAFTLTGTGVTTITTSLLYTKLTSCARPAPDN